MTDYSLDSWTPDWGAAPQGAAPVQAATVAPIIPSAEVRRKAADVGTFGAFFYGAADTVTFGFADEIEAGAEWLFLGKDYDKALEENRQIFDIVEEEHGAALLTGQLAGGFIPMLGWAGRVKKMVDAKRGLTATTALQSGSSFAKGLAVGGAIEGGLYGAGSADGDLYDRVKGAAMGGVFGGTFGYALGATLVPLGAGAKRLAIAVRQGRPQKLLKDFAPDVFNVSKAEGAVEEALADTATALKTKGHTKGEPAQPTPEAKAVRNIITGNADDVVEEGALLSTRELTGDMTKARKTIAERVGKITVQEAQVLARRFAKSEALGDVLADPHYRSLLGIDVSSTGVDPETAHRAAVLLEEATQAIIEKAGAAPKTLKQIEKEFRQRFEGEITESELNAAVDRASEAVTDARIADHVAMMASIQFSKAQKVLLPMVNQGKEEAREQLAETITHSISLMARANFIKSQAGRALASLKANAKLGAEDIVDDINGIEDLKSIEGRVRAALAQLDDVDLAAMMRRARTTRDVQEILNTIGNVEDAKTVGSFLRMQRTMVAFIQSTLLTPATGIFNFLGFVLHDAFRNHMAPKVAMFALKRGGHADEAFDLALETRVGNHVYRQTHMAGIRAMLDRMQWDHWDAVARIATLKGDDASRAAAKGKQKALLDKGYEPAPLREFETNARAKVQDPVAFNQRMRELEAQGGFANVWAAAQRAGAVGAEVLDHVGMAGARIYTGALDAWGGNMVRLKETYRLSARYAVREGRKAGLEGQDLADYVQKRSIELAEMPPANLLREAEEQLAKNGQVDEAIRFQMGVRSDAQKEADRVLFMDGPQTKPMRKVAGFLNDGKDVLGVDLVRATIFPYVNTPARIFERGMITYTPWGHKSREVKEILARGGPEAHLEMARMELGGMVIGMGALLGAAGAVTLTNGAYSSTGNLNGKPSNRLNLPGGAYVEFGRLDPFAYSLALGAIIGQALHERDHAQEVGYAEEEALATAWHTAFLAFREAVLDKSYLTGVRKVAQAFHQGKTDESTAGITRLAGELFETAVIGQIPMSGTMRQVSDTIRGEAPEAVGIMENVLRLIPRDMPVKRDWLGVPMDGRFMGISAGVKNPQDLRKALADQGLELADIERRDRLGFTLTGEELDQFREIRATEARTRDGLTLYEALEFTLSDPAFNTLPTRTARKARIMEVLDGLNENAREIMEMKNPGYAGKRIGHKSFAAYMAEGRREEEARRLATSDVTNMGLPDPEL